MKVSYAFYLRYYIDSYPGVTKLPFYVELVRGYHERSLR
jgi:hypothetical protein